MSPDEKQAIQQIILAEINTQREQNPTLLIDVLLSGQGFQFVYQVVAKVNAQSAQVNQTTSGLMHSLRGERSVSDIVRDREEVA